MQTLDGLLIKSINFECFCDSKSLSEMMIKPVMMLVVIEIIYKLCRK